MHTELYGPRARAWGSDEPRLEVGHGQGAAEVHVGEGADGDGVLNLADGDVLIGASALIARMNGVEKASHIRDKIVEMIHLNETMFSCGIACSVRGHQTLAGNWEIDMLLANVCKLNVTRFPYELARLATDIAGGLLGTMPSAKDLEDPVVGPYIKKYLAAAEGVEVVDRMKVLRLIENLVAGSGSVAYLIESVHGAGPPMAQRIMIGRQAGLESKINLAKGILDIQ